MRAAKWEPSPSQLSRWEMTGGAYFGMTYLQLQMQLENGDWLADEEDGFYPDPKDDAPLPLVHKRSRTIVSRDQSLSNNGNHRR